MSHSLMLVTFFISLQDKGRGNSRLAIGIHYTSHLIERKHHWTLCNIESLIMVIFQPIILWIQKSMNLPNLLSMFCWYTQRQIFSVSVHGRGHLASRENEICTKRIHHRPFGGCSGISILEKPLSLKMSSQVQSLQKQLTQLRQEAGVNRIPVSEAIQE